MKTTTNIACQLLAELVANTIWVEKEAVQNPERKTRSYIMGSYAAKETLKKDIEDTEHSDWAWDRDHGSNTATIVFKDGRRFRVTVEEEVDDDAV